MDEQIEEMRNDLSNSWHSDIIIGDKFKDVAEKLTKLGYRKIPENAVVLETSVYESLEIKNYRDVISERVRKETAERFAERLKERLDISVEGYSTSEVMSKIEDQIDEITKELWRRKG